MTATYKILFTINLLNEYYTNLQCKDFNIVPSAETALLLKNYKMLFKMTGNKLVALIKVNDQDEPFTGIDTDKKFVFYLHLVRPAFMNITNIDLDLMRSKRFYFTNLNQNEADGDLYLSNKIDAYILAYNNTLPYEKGDLVANEAGVVFECIQASAGSRNTTLDMFWKSKGYLQYRPGALAGNGTGAIFECIQSTNAGKNTTAIEAYWVDKGEFQYTSAQDMYPFITSAYNYQTAVAAKLFSIIVFAFNEVSGKYDLEMAIDKNIIETNDLTKNVQFDLAQLPAGRYRLKINKDEPVDVYLDNAAVYGNYFGAIEIFTSLAYPNEFALLDSSGKVKDKKDAAGMPESLHYTIRFANRLAFWKYIAAKKKVESIASGTNNYSFVHTALPSAPDFFKSSIPLALTESTKKFDMQIKAGTGAGDRFNSPAPNPNPQLSGMLTKDADDFYCNIYLNY